jgi:hypothetical protein
MESADSSWSVKFMARVLPSARRSHHRAAVDTAGMNDCVYQNRANIIHRTILRGGDFAQRSFVRRFVRQTQRFIKHVRRNVIGVRDVADSHPTMNRLVRMIVLVHSLPHRADYENGSDRDDQSKSCRDKPLSPSMNSHALLSLCGRVILLRPLV